MTKRLSIVAVAMLTVFAASSVSTAGAKSEQGPAVRAAHKTCQEERADLGREAFREKYGQQAMRNCVRATLPEARNASRACRAEREALGAEAFNALYGTNRNDRNAFGKCVSGIVGQSGDEEAA